MLLEVRRMGTHGRLRSIAELCAAGVLLELGIDRSIWLGTGLSGRARRGGVGIIYINLHVGEWFMSTSHVPFLSRIISTLFRSWRRSVCLSISPTVICD